MLSTNSTSSIQRRRQQHRRQQSLEVPILATPLPANPRRTRPANQGHRRGLSLDQSLSALTSPTGFRPLLSQDHGLPTAPIRIQIDATNTGHPPDQHTYVQETQQHRPAQPGYQAQDFQSHLQQQLNGNLGGSTPHIVAPTPTHANQEQALQDLQKHLEWYQQKFGHSPAPNVQNNTFFNLTQPTFNDMAMAPMGVQAMQQQPIVRHTRTPVSQGHSRTVPNTPQHHDQSWPSPPATETKHLRSQSFQLDVAPMPISFDGGHFVNPKPSPYTQPQDSFDFTDEQCQSVYSSSLVDAHSPGRQTNAGAMPTLFEDQTLQFGDHNHTGIPDDALLLQTIAGASDDFNSPNFMIGNSLGMSPHTAMLHSLGDDVNASIIETGIPAQEIESLISEQHPETKVWYCLFEDSKGVKCGKVFKRRENARSHVQNHLGDRQFQCNDCGKTFVRQHDMKRHSAIHKDDRPHICPCGTKFARHDALTRHRQRGMCAGTLPGFEKSEEDKPKRGRPKKERPDMDTRTSKAKKARRFDRDHDASAGGHYASSSSAMSERSYPVTPPDTGDFDADAFINMANVDVPMSSHASSWRDTPPTSPVSASPNKTISPALLADHSSPGTAYQGFTGASSPENGFGYDDVLFGTVASHPGVSGQEDLFSDALSPEYGSSDTCSPFNGNDDFGMDMEIMKGIAAEQWMEPVSTRMDGDGAVARALDRWLSCN